MSVLIDMEMPKTCRECAILANDGCCDYCPILEESITGLYAERLPKCPLREVPEEIDMPIFDKETRIENCTVQILENTKTGRTSVGWWRNDEGSERS